VDAIFRHNELAHTLFGGQIFVAGDEGRHIRFMRRQVGPQSIWSSCLKAMNCFILHNMNHYWFKWYITFF